MAKYEIIRREDGNSVIMDTETKQYFAGYDFMGSIDWKDEIDCDCLLPDYEDVEQLVRDMESADEPAEPNPADKQYLFKVNIEGEWIASVETGRKIAEYYETDQFCGIYSEMQVWDISGDPKRISLLDLVEPILNQKRWMEQEYRDYCDNVNEYGLDFEGRDE